MFGDELIIGYSEGKVADKRRLYLPAFTKGEENDRVVIELYNSVFKIYAYKEYEKIINKYLELRSKAETLEEYTKYTSKIEEICLNLASSNELDKQKRIIISPLVMQKAHLEIGDQIIYQGLGTSLLVRKK